MNQRLPVYIGRNAVAELLKYCQADGLDKFVLIADQNTYAALGCAVEHALQQARFDVISIVLHGAEVIADEHYIVQVLARLDRQARTFIAIGGGTLTDITRFVSHRTKTDFISMPAAPSVDGFTSPGAPLVLEGLKRTIICHPPRVLFADLPTLTAAPQRLIAAGYGDMVGKILSVADWKLGHILWDEAYDETIAQQFLTAAKACTDATTEIATRSEEGVRTLIAGLVDSGFGMLDFGNSAPASGAEHHMSHYWEMKLLREHRPAILHGAKVGVASILTAQRYAALRQISREQIAKQMQWSHVPTREHQEQTIHRAYGAIADEIIKEQAPFLQMNEMKFKALRDRIVARWDEVQEIACGIPLPQQFTTWLQMVGAPVAGSALGFSEAEVTQAFEFGHYLRNRFTINKLWFTLGLPAYAG